MQLLDKSVWSSYMGQSFKHYVTSLVTWVGHSSIAYTASTSHGSLPGSVLLRLSESVRIDFIEFEWI